VLKMRWGKRGGEGNRKKKKKKKKKTQFEFLV
jgi:hypothetical protein